MAASGPCKPLPRIREVRAYATDAQVSQGSHGSDCHDVGLDHWINGNGEKFPVIANPMSVHPPYKKARTSWGINALGSVVAEVEAEDGTTGVGVSIGGEPACYIVEKHLSRFVEGQRPDDVEDIWDQCYRATTNYGRKGLPLQALSALDLAIWDLLGKLRNAPVFSLLGGKTKARLPVYCTSASAKNAKANGFIGAKVPCPHGPADGDEGFRKNVEFFKKQREDVGPEYPLMLDCYMSLTVQYAAKLARALEPYGLKWIEECLMPDDYHGLGELKRMLDGKVLLTTGEHEYGRYGFMELIRQGVDIIQPDITWLGGLTEARRVVACAAAHDVLVIPHGSSVYSYHLQYAFRSCPIAEFISQDPNSEKIVPYFGDLFLDEPLPKDGYVVVDETKPGFGVTLNRTKLRRPYTRSADEVTANFNRNKDGLGLNPLTMPF